jgi:ATP-dependent Clp protease protease subunit
MNNERRKKNLETELFAINLDYAFNRGVDIQRRVIQLTEDIEEHHFDFFDAAMTTLEGINRKCITVKINSYGGDVYAALGIIGRMQESKCVIHTKGYGKIMSASTAILAAGTKRSISRLAEFMHHEASYGLEGRHSHIKNEVRQMEKTEQAWNRLMSELTDMPIDYWSKRGVGTNFYLTPDRCLELNIADEVF